MKLILTKIELKEEQSDTQVDSTYFEKSKVEEELPVANMTKFDVDTADAYK